MLHTEFRDAGGAEELTDVFFSGVVAHHFHDVLSGNILFGIVEISSSFGLSGFVLATAMELRPRESKAVLS